MRTADLHAEQAELDEIAARIADGGDGMTALDLLTALDARPVRPSTPSSTHRLTRCDRVRRGCARCGAGDGIPRSRCDRRPRQRRGDHDRGRACGHRSGRGRRDRLNRCSRPRRRPRVPARHSCQPSSAESDAPPATTETPTAVSPPRLPSAAGQDALLVPGEGTAGAAATPASGETAGTPSSASPSDAGDAVAAPAPPDVGAAGRTVSGPGDRPTGPAAPHPGSRDRRSRAPRHRRRERDGHRTGRLPAPSLHGRAGSHVDRALDLCCRGDDRRRRGPGTGGTLDPRIGRPRRPRPRRASIPCAAGAAACAPEPGRRHRSRPRGTAESAVAAPPAQLSSRRWRPPWCPLAQAPDGDHRITLTVSPENLGPVTVRALIAGSTIRIELHAPGELGRDALRAILGDLRRDLAIAAPQATPQPHHVGRLALLAAARRDGRSDRERRRRCPAAPGGRARLRRPADAGRSSTPAPSPHRPSLRSAASTSTA
ncbi:hypothetical protein AB1285_18715 [Microbacterium sp. NRRL B-14842]|uniref:hypothetical protein n=1 Tax=Microbacterium sp. NRRL B-14842 TaxID=3162881 RepID=UPI003D274140